MEYGLCSSCPYSTDTLCYYTQSDCGPFNRWYPYQKSSVGSCVSNLSQPFFSWTSQCSNLITQESKGALLKLFTTVIVADDAKSADILKGYEPALYLLHVILGTTLFSLLYLRNMWAVVFQKVLSRRYEFVLECVLNLLPTAFLIGYAGRLYMNGIKWDLHSIMGILFLGWIQVQTLTSGRFFQTQSDILGEIGTMTTLCFLVMVLGSIVPFRYEIEIPIIAFVVLLTFTCIWWRMYHTKKERPLTSRYIPNIPHTPLTRVTTIP